MMTRQPCGQGAEPRPKWDALRAFVFLVLPWILALAFSIAATHYWKKVRYGPDLEEVAERATRMVQSSYQIYAQTYNRPEDERERGILRAEVAAAMEVLNPGYPHTRGKTPSVEELAAFRQFRDAHAGDFYEEFLRYKYPRWSPAQSELDDAVRPPEAKLPKN